MKNFLNLKNIILIFISIILVTSCSNLDIQKLNNKANLLMKAGDIDGAISRLESINDLNPNFPQTHYNLGIAYNKKRQYDKAISSLQEALRLKNDFADAYYTLAVICEEKALSLIDKNKKPDKNTVLIINDNFKKSQIAYIQYLKLTKDSSDTEAIKNKIEFLNADIQKYDAMLNNNQNQQENPDNV
ncbi:MAG: tetratricopeptide repeat protein [Candidatus Gastranaerophilales bacterium]|nr:tetratricopeptide repeat protein [Candidatus Gastranaerophilales bacterium]